MINAVDNRKDKFRRYKKLRKNPTPYFEALEKDDKPYTAFDRIADTADGGSFESFDLSCPELDPLNFTGYLDKKKTLEEETGIEDAIVAGTCTIGGYKTVLCVMDKRFMMASMGIYVGEAVAKAAEYAHENKLPLIIFTASGGARMQEGIVALMQMAKTSAVIEKFKEEGGLYISVLTDPTTGGVSASFAMLGDITLAEEDALIGFAGPRVIEQTIGEKLPKGFQRADFLKEHGHLDEVVKRSAIRSKLILLLKLHERKQ